MASCDASFRDEIVDRCLSALVSVGFVRYRKKSVEWPIRDGFYCWVGLNQGLYSARLHIEPFVGIHVEPLEKLWQSLQGEKRPGKYDRGVATYATHVGELESAKEEPAFVFTPTQSEQSIRMEAERMAHLYLAVGLPFSESIASYDALLPLLLERVPMLGGYPQRVVSCLYLMGRRDEAREFAEDFLRANREVFEGFAVPFFDMLKREQH